MEKEKSNMRFPVVNVIDTANSIIYYGKAKMVAPPYAMHVRQTEIRLPRLFTTKPTVTLTITSPDSNGTMFSVWDVQINDLGAETQVAVSAANIEIGRPSTFGYWCDFVIIAAK